MSIAHALIEVAHELDRACAKFPKMRSPHEGYAIILEELEELKAEVFKQHEARRDDHLRNEAMQVAAMAIRFMIDLTHEKDD